MFSSVNYTKLYAGRQSSSAATKKRVSKRAARTFGVIQCENGTSKSNAGLHPN